MITQHEITLAAVADVLPIAQLSRDTIEQGLSWSWTPRRVMRSLKDNATNVVVARAVGQLGGFAIMKYGDEEAHLLLLAVKPSHRRCGVASEMLAWLERSAEVAGVGRITLEARASNDAARAFYLRHGYAQAQLLPGYYGGRETSVRMVKSFGLSRTGAL